MRTAIADSLRPFSYPQFGEQLALYFAFLSFYTKSLIVPVALGLASFWLSKPFNPYYSASVCAWSVIFVEWWRLKQRSISIRWGSFGAEKVQLRRSQFKGANDSNDEHDDTSFPWWKREGRILASLPVIAVFATALTGLLTTIFVVEAFVTQLYTGPAVRYVSLTPTAMFLLLVPRLVGFYQTYATRLTGWENHVHEVNYEKSLAYKTFAMSSIVAFGGLYLSAFVYVPFGEQIMQLVQQTFFTSPTARSSSVTDEKIASLKDAKKVLNPDRLKNQVFAYLITNQVIGEFLEVGVPSLMRFLGWAKEQAAETEIGKKGLKKVGFHDEKTDAAGAGTSSTASEEEKRFLDDVRSQVALPAYDVFGESPVSLVLSAPLFRSFHLAGISIPVRTPAYVLGSVGKRRWGLPPRLSSIKASHSENLRNIPSNPTSLSAHPLKLYNEGCRVFRGDFRLRENSHRHTQCRRNDGLLFRCLPSFFLQFRD